MEIFERYLVLGCDVAGRVLSGIRSEARFLGLELSQEPLAIFLTLNPTQTVKITARGNKLEEFIKYMDENYPLELEK